MRERRAGNGAPGRASLNGDSRSAHARLRIGGRPPSRGPRKRPRSSGAPDPPPRARPQFDHAPLTLDPRDPKSAQSPTTCRHRGPRVRPPSLRAACSGAPGFHLGRRVHFVPLRAQSCSGSRAGVQSGRAHRGFLQSALHFPARRTAPRGVRSGGVSLRGARDRCAVGRRHVVAADTIAGDGRNLEHGAGARPQRHVHQLRAVVGGRAGNHALRATDPRRRGGDAGAAATRARTVRPRTRAGRDCALTSRGRAARRHTMAVPMVRSRDAARFRRARSRSARRTGAGRDLRGMAASVLR